MNKRKVEHLKERLNRLAPKPNAVRQEAFSSHQLAIEIKEAMEVLAKERGDEVLSDSYGRDYRHSVLDVIQKAEARDFQDAHEFIEQLSEDEGIGLAHLICQLENV